MSRAVSMICAPVIVILIFWMSIPVFGCIAAQLSRSLPPSINFFPKDELAAMMLGGAIGFVVAAVGTSLWVVRVLAKRPSSETKEESGDPNNNMHTIVCRASASHEV